MRLHHLALVSSAVLVLAVAACTAGSTTQSPITGGPDSGSGGDGGNDRTDGSSGGGGDGGSTIVTADGLSKTCAVDEDCLAVYVGDACGFCNFGNTAIAKSDQAAYQIKYNAARANCPPVQGGGSCVADQNITFCNAQKTCQLVMCPMVPVNAHHCDADAGDGG